VNPAQTIVFDHGPVGQLDYGFVDLDLVVIGRRRRDHRRRVLAHAHRGEEADHMRERLRLVLARELAIEQPGLSRQQLAGDFLVVDKKGLRFGLQWIPFEVERGRHSLRRRDVDLFCQRERTPSAAY
jgi:septum formation topological specificity factor MinE